HAHPGLALLKTSIFGISDAFERTETLCVRVISGSRDVYVPVRKDIDSADLAIDQVNGDVDNSTRPELCWQNKGDLIATADLLHATLQMHDIIGVDRSGGYSGAAIRSPAIFQLEDRKRKGGGIGAPAHCCEDERR